MKLLETVLRSIGSDGESVRGEAPDRTNAEMLKLARGRYREAELTLRSLGQSRWLEVRDHLDTAAREIRHAIESHDGRLAVQRAKALELTLEVCAGS